MKRIIIVTDGDEVARKAVEIAAKNIGARTISLSSGNPTRLTEQELIDLINQAPYDPVVVMADDCGDVGPGRGERLILALARNTDIEILGVLAVASNTRDGEKCKVHFSITAEGEVIDEAVDKKGNKKGTKYLLGDTLSVLKNMDIPVIVGIGDPGKMDFKDNLEEGAPITTKALEKILEKSGYDTNKKGNQE